MTFYDRIELLNCTYFHRVVVVETPRFVVGLRGLGVCLYGVWVIVRVAVQVLILHKALGNVELCDSALLNLEKFLFLGLEQAPKNAVWKALARKKKIVVGGFSLAVVVGDIIAGRYCNGFIFDNVVEIRKLQGRTFKWVALSFIEIFALPIRNFLWPGRYVKSYCLGFSSRGGCCVTAGALFRQTHSLACFCEHMCTNE